MKRLLSLLGLTLLGALVFAGFAALVEYRQGHPLRPPTEPQVSQGETERRPQEMIAVGTRLSATTAQQALKRGARSEAVHALDAAMRAAEVGKHASHGQRQKAFQAGCAVPQ